MRLLVIAPGDFRPLDLLRQEAPDVELSVGIDADQLRVDARRADAVLLAPRYDDVLLNLAPELQHVQWIHALAAGVESLPFEQLKQTDATLTNSRGLYAEALGEFAVAAMMWFAKDLRRLVVNQQKRRWEPYTVERLEGRTLGIIGYGGIGQAVGRRAAALGMHVTGVRRQQDLGDATIEDLLAQSDYLVLSTPLTPSTAGLMSRQRFALMKPTAVFINLGRGRCVDEAAMIDALRERKIRGAALDVFETEPLPADNPLWDLDNVLLSPHTADHTEDSHLIAMRFFIDNLRRFRSGDALENVVNKDEQY